MPLARLYNRCVEGGVGWVKGTGRFGIVLSALLLTLSAGAPLLYASAGTGGGVSVTNTTNAQDILSSNLVKNFSCPDDGAPTDGIAAYYPFDGVTSNDAFQDASNNQHTAHARAVLARLLALLGFSMPHYNLMGKIISSLKILI